jgi:hypothetical protein
MAQKKYIIGESSQRLLTALEKFHEFQNSLLDALKFMYGEEAGENHFLELNDKLEDIERSGIMEYLRISFGLEMGINKQTIEL